MVSLIKIIEKIELKDWDKLISNYSENKIVVSDHALFRLSEKQRKVFKAQELINILLKKRPILIGLQNNKRYAVFIKNKETVLRIIIEITENKIEINTFYNIKPEQIPRI
ncbi:hypothetical protein HZA97_05580 [Candidatus Woesearchaeota archaeon]|nr:hypothetical protein [Candidatus Woesearchaeota archaeon]